ncbi:uncharacterized protein LOC6526159 [Drosophila yakuba]|uniref:Uncharacterized protein n=1 Tax=Drosophila yakuba TaxID=7245 RepID=B4PZ18_DROYA|nr:uncharacterized protein LOC6526159 [Drosophila yakuba]EDX03079.1 uncharacterized protein Dyak_GE15309 [Drosophila yakuba]
MPKSTQRSPIKVVSMPLGTKQPQCKRKSAGKSKPNVLQKSVKKSLKKPLKKPMRRSPLMRAALQPTVLGLAKVRPVKKSQQVTFKKSHRQPLDALQSLGMSRRTKLIDARPQRTAGGTSVLFLGKDSRVSKVSKVSKNMKHPAAASERSALPRMKRRMEPRWMMKAETRATDGVNFFCNLGVRMQPLTQRTQKDQQVGQRGEAGFRGRLAGGEGTRLGDGILQGTVRAPPSGLSSLVGKVAGIGASANDVVVPLTSRLPIIDFISTKEFQNMSAASTRKPNSRKNIHL